jgi:hypothetical protein
MVLKVISPLVCLGVDRIGVHSYFRKELVEQPKEPWIARTEGLL